MSYYTPTYNYPQRRSGGFFSSLFCSSRPSSSTYRPSYSTSYAPPPYAGNMGSRSPRKYKSAPPVYYGGGGGGGGYYGNGRGKKGVRFGGTSVRTYGYY
ncbi:hypothetical protein M231_05019 [Tremella mesenterica]|uniref:Uncharacterized protein n=2 Tax=Tremella mesenterica TaxID=5217 RepID=A0A4Q1BJ88_TREME|nr:hypothetical protein M231_05019 [Tremella mesenterica]